MNVSSPGPSNKANIFLVLTEYGLNSISIHIRFDLERYLLKKCSFMPQKSPKSWAISITTKM